MAKPNYSFEKRQREQAKKKKKEEKVREKAGRKVGDAGSDSSVEDGQPAQNEATAVAPALDQPAT
jgi:hypothetical protein